MKKTNTLNRAKYAASAAPVALGMALAFTPSAAQAQDTSASSSGGPIIVTGTRVNRPDLESVSPLTVVGAEEIAATGTTRAEDLINALPQVVAGQTAFISNGATGTATVNLRNLGSIRTLVLIDGRRMPSGDPFAVAPDINQIPAALVERIELVTGGASATYGADAVSGVVNFIMNRDFEGIQADAQVSFYVDDNKDDVIQDLLTRSGNASPRGTQVDGFGYDFNVVMGAGFDDGRGHVTGYLGYRQIDPVTQATRDRSACALANSATDPSNYVCSGSSTTPNGRFLVFDPAAGFAQTGDFTLDQNDQPGGVRNYTGADSYNFAPTNYFQRPDKRWTAGFFAEYEISPSVIPYAEFQFMDDRSVAQIAFSGTFFTNSPIPCSNPLISPEQAIAFLCDTNADGTVDATEAQNVSYTYVGKRLVEGLPRQSDNRHTSNRAVLGVRGEISPDWSYDAYILRGNTIFQNTYLNDLSISRINNALDVVNRGGTLQCRNDVGNGCVPLNVFQIGGVDRAQFNYITVNGLVQADLETDVASGFISGNLDNPLGTVAPISVVFGAEYRKEQYQLRSDQNFQEGNLSGQGSPTLPSTGEYSVRELFTELRLPLFDFGNGGTVEAIGGYRLSDYTTVGTTHTYKGGLEIQPIEGLRFRGIYNRAVRAPNIVELFAPQQIALFSGQDPCAGATPTASQAACANAGVSAAQYGGIPDNPAQQYNQIISGNPNLDVEKADSYTVGMVVDGRSLGLDGFTATVDYFNINVNNVISSIGAQAILNGCVNSGTQSLCQLINRDNAGTIWLTPNGFVTNAGANLGGLKTSGIDFSAGYRFPLGPGSLNANLVGTYYFNSEFKPQPTGSFYDCIGYYGSTCGSPQPHYRHRFSLGYNADGGWGVTARWRHFGGVDADVTSSDPQLAGPAGRTPTVDDHIGSFDWFDLSASYDVNDNLRLSAGVNNIFDRDPPTIGSGFSPSNGTTFPGIYDPVGRYVFLAGRISF